MMGNSVFVFQNSKRGKILNSYLLGLHSPVRGKFSPTEIILEAWFEEMRSLHPDNTAWSKKDAISIIKKKLNSLLLGIQERMTGNTF